MALPLVRLRACAILTSCVPIVQLRVCEKPNLENLPWKRRALDAMSLLGYRPEYEQIELGMEALAVVIASLCARS